MASDKSGPGSYGYKKRKDPETRLIPAGQGESRVGSPLRIEARRLSQVADVNIGGGGGAGRSRVSDERMIFLGSLLNSPNWIGTNAYIQSGTVGTIWDANIKRYCRRITASTGNGSFRVQDTAEARAVLDPLFGAGQPLKIRFRDTLVLTFTTATPPSPSFNYSARAQFCLAGTEVVSTAFGDLFPFIGFEMLYSSGFGTNSLMFWSAKIVDENLTTLYRQVTTKNAKEIHDFEIELDCATYTVNFYIDGELLGSYTFASNSVPGQLQPYPSGFNASSWGLSYTCTETHGGATAMPVQFNAHLSPGGPIISVLYEDA
jgi:hypothetical protein